MIVHIIYLVTILGILIMRKEMYSEKDLVSFGSYMVSWRRNRTIEKPHLKKVCNDADIENWKYEEGK